MRADWTEVTSEERLDELVGEMHPYVAGKVQPKLDEMAIEWLAASPFAMIATSDPEGRIDVSPRGDPEGFALVLDETTIAIPDRSGNKRVDGFRNILRNPRVGTLFIVPGRGDTLRVNGRGTVVEEAPFFDEMIVNGHRPDLALVIDVEEVFFHCPKAFLRAKLWEPAAWRPDERRSRRALSKQAASALENVAARTPDSQEAGQDEPLVRYEDPTDYTPWLYEKY